MINELYELSQSLHRYGLAIPATHPDIGNVGKCVCLLIELNKQGQAAGSRLLSKDETAELWKHSRGNHHSFPAIRIQKPLLAPGESEKRNEMSTPWNKCKREEKLNMLRRIDFSNDNPESRDIKIDEWTRNALDTDMLGGYSELKALKLLIERFPLESKQGAFYKTLVYYLQKVVEETNDDDTIDFVADMLLGNPDAKKGGFVAGCMTYFDVYETTDVSHKVAGSGAVNALINALNANAGDRATQSVNALLPGESSKPIGGKYPNPNLPLIGLTYLYSKKEDTLCLARYDMSGTKAFAASEPAIADIHNALAFLTKPDRKKKTWSAITDNDKASPNLLLAYLESDPQNDALLAQILSEIGDTDSDDAESAFETLCEQVLKNIDAVLRKNPRSKINMIILGALDPGRKQIIYGNSFSVERFCDNILRWAEASKNHPQVCFRARRKKAVKNYLPVCPGPDEICKLLKLHYSRRGESGGQQKQRQQGGGNVYQQRSGEMSLHDIYTLYMPQSISDFGWAAFIEKALYKTLLKTKWLLADIGMARTLEYKAIASLNENALHNACLAISLISILLWQSGIKKEVYTMEVPFNIGRFLQLADVLHKEYCIQIRNGGKRGKALPPQLMGNELLLIALENPNECLVRLCERMRIYIAWATTATGEGVGLAKWVLSRYGQVCKEISGKAIPETFSTAEQAQVLLGYLAEIPNKKKEEESNV